MDQCVLQNLDDTDVLEWFKEDFARYYESNRAVIFISMLLIFKQKLKHYLIFFDAAISSCLPHFVSRFYLLKVLLCSNVSLFQMVSTEAPSQGTGSLFGLVDRKVNKLIA